MYAVGDHRAWATSVVTTPGNFAIQLALAVDEHASPHFSFYDWSDGMLKYARLVHPIALAAEEGAKDAVEPSASRGSGTIDGLVIAPNPIVSRRAEIRFEVKVASPVELFVYDLEGRLVRNLMSGSAPAGTQSTGWDATDDDGRAVAPGVYFLRMRAGDISEVKRITLLR
jgi:hypothetical protein